MMNEGSSSSLAGLRLLIVADSTSTHTHRWAQWFADAGCDVTVLSQHPDPIERVRVVQFPAGRKWYHRIPKARMLIDYFAFKRLIRQLRPQLVHFHFVSEGGRAFYWDAVDVPMVASTWGQDVVFDGPPIPKIQKSLRRMLARVNLITATTHMLAGATAEYSPPGKPIYCIPFGVDLQRFSTRDEKPGDPITLGFVKHLLPKYGPDVLIEAFAIVHRERPNTRLVMAGRGTMREHLEKRIAELNLTDAVSILGRVAHAEVPALIRSFDIMVMPSIYESETFGVTAVEASACRIPNIASRIGGVPEAVIDGKTGLLVPPRDVNALAQACIDLIDNPDKRRRMGQTGRKFVEKYYAWQDNALAMEEIYRAALQGDEPRGLVKWQQGVEPKFEV